MMIDKIELISTNILSQQHNLSKDLYVMNRNLALSAGWHYILDWTWVVNQVRELENKVILEAGAGIGLLQWYFARQGAHVISVDRSDRKCIPFHLVNLFNVGGLTDADKPLNLINTINIFNGKASFSKRIKSLARGAVGSLLSSNYASTIGSVKLYKQDLENLAHIDDNSVDLVISISALEHNQNINSIKKIASELLRVLKKGGKMIITLPASNQTDWFFKPAYSWCFTDTTIRDIFALPEATPSNYAQYETFFMEIKSSKYLKSKLSWRYYFSSNSGMPYGKWNPQYIPVGISKIKQ